MNNTIFKRLISHIQAEGILITDIKRLERYVTKYNYNRVFKPYLKLINKETAQKLEITSDDLLNLYELDRKISYLFLNSIFEIEMKLNTLVAYTIEDTLKIYHGCLFKLDKKFVQGEVLNNCTKPECGMTFDQLISKMTKYAHINPNTNIYEDKSKNNLFQKWKNCPLDALNLSWTFTTTVLTYLACNNRIKNKIVRSFNLSNNKVENFDRIILKVLELRNLITHNNVIFSNMLNLQDNTLVNDFNKLFNTRKHWLDFYDFGMLICFLSSDDNLINELKHTFDSFKFSLKVEEILKKLLFGRNNNER